jgi:hypothetical protein
MIHFMYVTTQPGVETLSVLYACSLHCHCLFDTLLYYAFTSCMQPEAALHVGREKEGLQLRGVQGGTPDRNSNGLFLTDKGKQQVL